MTRSYTFKPTDTPNHHQIYEAYIKKLGLSSIHDMDLRKRGLLPGHIKAAEYATKKRNNVHDTIMALGYVDNLYDLSGVPGFYIDNYQRKQSGVCGLVAPVRDYLGGISSLIVKNDTPSLNEVGKPIDKYISFSSNKKTDGAKVTQTTHCPVIRGVAKAISGRKPRLTEGVIKSDVATALDGDTYCFGAQGLNIPKDFANTLDQLEISELILSFDAGEDENEDMIEAKAKFVDFCDQAGIEFDIEIWDPKYGKGIDDVLLAGHQDKIRYATQGEIDEIRSSISTIRPIIEVRGGGLSDQATKGEKALIDAKLPIYQRSSTLVTPIVQKTEASKGRQTKIAVLHPVSKTRMRDHLCEVARWQKTDSDGELYDTDPPVAVSDTILNRYGVWKFLSLAGVIMTPTLRPDGSILMDKGYDPATRLYLLDAPEMPDIADEPTKDDAIAALKLLDDLLVDFPFVNAASRSVALSALITPILRGAFDVVPMHVISAPTPGTGKSYLLDTASAIAIGQPCPIIAAGRTEEETEKRLGAALLTGQSILSIDNLNGDLAGDALCQAIERPLFTMRILGESRNVTIESRSTLYANGNNIRLRGDITRRAVQCVMDAGIERPEFRPFSIDPVQMVLNDRGKYIAAILTIAKAYILANKPNTLKPRLASFEDWSDLVRSCLVWLDCADPLDTMEEARSEDPELQAMTNVFTALWDVTEGKKRTAKQIVGLALGQDDANFEHDEQRAEVLKEALMNVSADNKGFITPLRLGKWLSRKKGRICNNLKLENEVDSHGHAAKWYLIDLADRGSAGESGSIPTETKRDEDDLPM